MTSVRRFAAGATLLIGIAGFASANSEATAPQPFTATYEAEYRGIRAGELTFKLERDADGRYIYETRANPSALARLIVSRDAVERTVMEIDANGVRPIEWILDDGKSGEKGDGALRFDWGNGVVTGRIGGEDIRFPTEPKMQDRLSIQIAVVTALLRGQEPGEFPMIDDNRVKRYTYTKKQLETVETPLGPFETTIYESTRPGSSRIARFWLAPRLNFTPARAVQVRKGKVETVMILKAWGAGD